VLPHCIGNIYTYHTNSVYIDIGTPEALAEAEAICSILTIEHQIKSPK